MEERVIKGGFERRKDRVGWAASRCFGNFNSFSNEYARATEARRKKEEHTQRALKMRDFPALSPRLSSDNDESKKQAELLGCYSLKMVFFSLEYGNCQTQSARQHFFLKIKRFPLNLKNPQENIYILSYLCPAALWFFLLAVDWRADNRETETCHLQMLLLSLCREEIEHLLMKHHTKAHVVLISSCVRGYYRRWLGNQVWKISWGKVGTQNEVLEPQQTSGWRTPWVCDQIPAQGTSGGGCRPLHRWTFNSLFRQPVSVFDQIAETRASQRRSRNFSCCKVRLVISLNCKLRPHPKVT